MGENRNRGRYFKTKQKVRKEQSMLRKEAGIYKQNLRGRLPRRYPFEIVSKVPKERRNRFYGALILSVILIFIMYGYLSLKQYATPTSSYYVDNITKYSFLIFAFILLVIFIYVSLHSECWLDEEGISFNWSFSNGFIPYENIKSVIVESDDFDNHNIHQLHIQELGIHRMPLFLVIIIRLKIPQQFSGILGTKSELWLKVPESEYYATLIKYLRIKSILRYSY